jgi:pimeloyl-ACP methyl ester carboxylesterase/quercetin dioxygenase-like cupin family protein
VSHERATFWLRAALTWIALTGAAAAAVVPYPNSFRTQNIAAQDATLFVRIGGHGPAVVLLHGFGDTGDMWEPLAVELARNHTVIVPDLRGMGLSSHPVSGYDKMTQAADIRAVLTALGVDHADVVGHDIGTMVAYAYASRYPDKTDRLIVMDAPIPGIPPWDDLVRSPLLWHFSFGGPDAERLVAGRERIYLDRFYNDFAGDPSRIDEATRNHYAELYARAGSMHSAFAQFLSFPKDAADNKLAMRSKLTMPVLAIGGEKSFGSNEALVMRNAATRVTGLVIPDSGHWLMAEQPNATIVATRNFLDQTKLAGNPREIRLRPQDFDFHMAEGAGAGTSGVSGIRTIALKGDPSKDGLYTILLRVPAHTRIAAHRHPDDRIATVVSGTWYFGYGDKFDDAKLRALPPGSFYTEPPSEDHFAETRDSDVLVQISGLGPTGTAYVDPADDPTP